MISNLFPFFDMIILGLERSDSETMIYTYFTYKKDFKIINPKGFVIEKFDLIQKC